MLNECLQLMSYTFEETLLEVAQGFVNWFSLIALYRKILCIYIYTYTYTHTYLYTDINVCKYLYIQMLYFNIYLT